MIICLQSTLFVCFFHLILTIPNNSRLSRDFYLAFSDESRSGPGTRRDPVAVVFAYTLRLQNTFNPEGQGPVQIHVCSVHPQSNNRRVRVGLCLSKHIHKTRLFRG